jgi:chitodextrinase
LASPHRSPRRLRIAPVLLVGVLVAALVPTTARAAGPIASSSFVGAENPLSESGAWAALTSFSPNGGRFQKNNGARPNMVNTDMAGARTTAVVPADQVSEIVVGQIGQVSNLGPTVRVQTSGPQIDSHYLWWVGTDGQSGLYRMDANGTTANASLIVPTASAAAGDRLRLIARGQVIYGNKNGLRAFVYNTARDQLKYAGGTTGMLAFTRSDVTNATIASWSTDAAPVSTGTVASTDFVGAEDPLDEGDRWYPLPGYSGFKKAGGFASGRDFDHNATGVWSIAPPQRQYSEVTLGTVAGGSGGPIVRIQRNASGHSGWLLYLGAAGDAPSGIWKMELNGTHSLARVFSPTIVPGDKWRLTADGNTLEVFQNGVSQFTFTTDGTYPTGDVGMEAYRTFSYTHWEGGALAAGGDTTPPSAPSGLSAAATSPSQVDLSWTASTDNVAVKDYQVERCVGAGCTNFAFVTSTTATTFSDTGRAASTTYRYQVRATDAAGNTSLYSNIASATTPAPPPPPDTEAPTAPGLLLATPTVGGQIDLTWGAATDNVGVRDYLVERCAGLACTGFAFIGTATGTTYSDTGLAAATSYSYRVRARDAAGNQGPNSNVGTALTLAAPDTTPPTAPSNLVPTVGGPNRTSLAWTPSVDDVGVQAYLVERCKGLTCTGFVEVGVVAAASYDDTGLESNTVYKYRVRAKDRAGNLSAYSNVATATTLALGL